MGRGLLLHLIHFFFGHAAGGGDGDLLLLVGGRVLGLHVQDAVGVDVKGDFNLRHAARRRRNADQVELAQRAVVARHRALALQDVHLHRGLAVGGGGENLALAGGDGGVARDQRGHHAAQRLDAERERGDVEQQHVLHFARQHARLHRRAHPHHFVGVDALVRLALEEFLHHLLHPRDAGGAAHQHHFVNLAGLEPGVFQRLLARPDGALDQVFHQLLQLGPGQLQLQVLGAALVGSDEGQVDFSLLQLRELDLGLLGRFLQPLQGHAVFGEVNPLVLAELVDDPLDDLLVNVVAAQVGVAAGGFDFGDALAHLQDGDVEGAAAEVINGDGLFLLLIQPVGQRRRRRLVDDAHHFQPGNLPGVLGGLPLAVVEVSRHGDDRLRHLLAQEVLRRLLQLLQHHGRDFRRRVLLAHHVHARVAVLRPHDVVRNFLDLVAYLLVATAHEALNRIDRVLRVGDGLPLGYLSHQPLPRLGKTHYRRRQPTALLVGHHHRLAPLHHRDYRVGRPQVNSNDLPHCLSS